MATSKRQRQKAARRAKIEQMQREAKRRKNFRRAAIVIVVAAVVIFTGAYLFAGKSTNNSTTTTTAAASATTTTAAPTTTTTVSSSTTSSTTTTVATTTTTAGSTAGESAVSGFPSIADPSPAGKTGVAPTVIVPTTAPPKILEAEDLFKGTGAEAVNGRTLEVQYVLATYSTHKVIQSSWTSSPFSFVLGANTVIKGWEQGMVGMRAGGRRELIIPPSLGYGSQNPGGGISANDTLVFVVDLLKVS
ncbi:MAG: FKBP-type peptidyl-prolyl cis-trans isomerase [Acidimicrobiales bacterium]|jgi:peptidylprolyl isomerase